MTVWRGHTATPLQESICFEPEPSRPRRRRRTWIKHLAANSRDERFVHDGSMERHALSGVYWRLNEIICEHMKGDTPSCGVSFPISLWARLIPLRASLVATMLQKIADDSTIGRAGRLTVERSGDVIRVTNRRLAEDRSANQEGR